MRNGLHSLWLTGLLVLSGSPVAFSQQRVDYDAIVGSMPRPTMFRRRSSIG